MLSLVNNLEAQLREWRPETAAGLEQEVMQSLARLEREEAFPPVKASGAPVRIVLAAGGILWQRTDTEKRLAVIHRARYDDWSLPKGKLDPGESLSQAARREVWEETACKAILRKFAGVINYVVKAGPKFVFYWEMDAIQIQSLEPSSEVDQVEWLSVGAALERFSYDIERDFLRRALAIRND